MFCGIKNDKPGSVSSRRTSVAIYLGPRILSSVSNQGERISHLPDLVCFTYRPAPLSGCSQKGMTNTLMLEVGSDRHLLYSLPGTDVELMIRVKQASLDAIRIAVPFWVAPNSSSKPTYRLSPLAACLVVDSPSRVLPVMGLYQCKCVLFFSPKKQSGGCIQLGNHEFI